MGCSFQKLYRNITEKSIKLQNQGLALWVVLMTLVGHAYGSLYVGFYRGKCGKYDVEEVVFNVVEANYLKNPNIVAKLIRLQFHDCIVRGCDASVLLDGNDSEKTAVPNLSLGGFEVVDEAKDIVETLCPGVVSCADILIMAARSAVFMAGGNWYYAETGRRDGRVSSRGEALASLPPPNIPVHNALHQFAQHGLNKEDFVVLLGGHTVGTGHCDLFQNRLYNFQNSGTPDARMNPSLLRELKGTCPQKSRVNKETFLDHTPASAYRIDNGYYQQILTNKGILEVDTNIAYSPLTNAIARKLAFTPDYFLDKFGPAMIKMGRIGVLTGKQGEIRRHCRMVN